MSGEPDLVHTRQSNVELFEANDESDRGSVLIPEWMILKAHAPISESWIHKIIKQIVDSPLHWVTPFEVVPVAVLAVQRYLLEDRPYFSGHKAPFYCYDVTISDGVLKEKCYLDPGLNHLVYKNILRVGIEMEISRVSFIFNERKLDQGILCIDKIQCGKALDIIYPEIPFRNGVQGESAERPLRGRQNHYLALWNNEDPYGCIWLNTKPSEEYNFDDTKIISLSHLEMIWNTRKNFPALLVRIMHKSKLRYYGKPHNKTPEPYQAFLEVADSSGTATVTLWSTLCREWYKNLNVGLVLLLQDYSVRKRFPFRKQPLPVDPQMKVISSIEICLSLHDSPNNITLIPEIQVKPAWELPRLKHHFLLRSELDNVPENTICDIIGFVVFVGRVQRSRKKENHEDFWIYRWIHVIDGTSKLPFIVKLFSTSQPEVFTSISPLVSFVCTQLKVIRINNEVRNMLYLITTNESRMFTTAHKGQAYTREDKVRRFTQWFKEKSYRGEMNIYTVIGGYYAYPPVLDISSKYTCSLKVESLLTAISEVRKVIQDVQYREQKRIAIQGIITVIKFIPHSVETERTCASETLQDANQPSTSKADGETQSWYRRDRKQPNDGPMRCQSVPAIGASSSPSRKKRIVQGLQNSLLITVSQPEISIEEREDKCGQPNCYTCQEGEYRNPLCTSWESHLWKKKKYGLVDHQNYSFLYPESIPRKYDSEYKQFLSSQFNAHPAQYSLPTEADLKLEKFKSAVSLDGHFEITILGLNHEIAIDVAFLPMYSPEDIQTNQVDTLLNSMNYDCVYPQVNENVPDAKEIAGDVIRAIVEMDRMHIIAVLDIFNLGENKLEVILHRIYCPDNTFKVAK
ncbi:RPA-related protein RADX [Sorex araneus]|uniref:RPA-related protein RADX n=1 Tax=Sorex araneus TaxID=42254 RepID=UPI00243368F1|nr:RPA-related protein RADX [Sorex araneus]